MKPAKDEREGKPRTAFAKDPLCGKDRTSGYDGADAAASAADAPTAPVFGNSLYHRKRHYLSAVRNRRTALESILGNRE